DHAVVGCRDRARRVAAGPSSSRAAPASGCRRRRYRPPVPGPGLVARAARRRRRGIRRRADASSCRKRRPRVVAGIAASRRRNCRLAGLGDLDRGHAAGRIRCYGGRAHHRAAPARPHALRGGMLRLLRNLRRIGLLLLAVAVMWLAGLAWFVTTGLIQPPDASAKTDAIVVLTGGRLRL